jgi:hypothetical protein
LFFLGREVLGPIVSAKQQHVSILILCVHMIENYVWLSLSGCKLFFSRQFACTDV